MNIDDYTNLEQSKELLKLGIDPKTASCRWELVKHDGYDPTYVFSIAEPLKIDIPSWSVADLIKLIPKGFSLTKYNTYIAGYDGHYNTRSEKAHLMSITCRGDSLLSSIYQLVLYLISSDEIITIKHT